MAKAEGTTEQIEAATRRIVIEGLARGDDVPALAKQLSEHDPRGIPFAGALLIGLGADVLEMVDASRERPVAHEGLKDRFLPECEFVGRQNRKLQYALLCVGATRGGVDVDFAEELYWWRTDDFWYYAPCAVVAWTRASAYYADLSVTEICDRLAVLHNVKPSS